MQNARLGGQVRKALEVKRWSHGMSTADEYVDCSWRASVAPASAAASRVEGLAW